MIYVRDNGESYSDHGLDFINVPDDADEKHRNLLVKAIAVDKFGLRAFVLGIFREIAWYEGGSNPVRDWLSEQRRDASAYDILSDEEIKLLDDALAVLWVTP